MRSWSVVLFLVWLGATATRRNDVTQAAVLTLPSNTTTSDNRVTTGATTELTDSTANQVTGTKIAVEPVTKAKTASAGRKVKIPTLSVALVVTGLFISIWVVILANFLYWRRKRKINLNISRVSYVSRPWREDSEIKFIELFSVVLGRYLEYWLNWFCLIHFLRLLFLSTFNSVFRIFSLSKLNAYDVVCLLDHFVNWLLFPAT